MTILFFLSTVRHPKWYPFNVCRCWSVWWHWILFFLSTVQHPKWYPSNVYRCWSVWWQWILFSSVQFSTLNGIPLMQAGKLKNILALARTGHCLIYSLYKIQLAQACFTLARLYFHSHWGAVVSQPANVYRCSSVWWQWISFFLSTVQHPKWYPSNVYRCSSVWWQRILFFFSTVPV